MILRVALYAEGGGELTGAQHGLPPVPGDPLPPEVLGPAHFLVQRSINSIHHVPERAIQFQSPLRTDRGRVPKGSDFLTRTTLRRLLTWPNQIRQPDLAIVIVDSDGEQNRKNLLESYIADLPVRHVIGVAINEFEAWLLADQMAVKEAAGSIPAGCDSPEKLDPGRAKELLRSVSQRNERTIRLSIARSCDVNALKQRCRSFEAFLHDLKFQLQLSL